MVFFCFLFLYLFIYDQGIPSCGMYLIGLIPHNTRTTHTRDLCQSVEKNQTQDPGEQIFNSCANDPTP